MGFTSILIGDFPVFGMAGNKWLYKLLSWWYFVITLQIYEHSLHDQTCWADNDLC